MLLFFLTKIIFSNTLEDVALHGDNSMSLNLKDADKQYIVISNEVSKPDKYHFYVRKNYNTYIMLDPGQLYWINGTLRFYSEIYATTDHCHNYAYVKRLESTALLKEDEITIQRITDKDLLSYCELPSGVGNFIMIIVFVFIIILLVVAIIVVTVVLKKKIRQKDATPANQSMLNTSL